MEDMVHMSYEAEKTTDSYLPMYIQREVSELYSHTRPQALQSFNGVLECAYVSMYIHGHRESSVEGSRVNLCYIPPNIIKGQEQRSGRGRGRNKRRGWGVGGGGQRCGESGESVCKCTYIPKHVLV